MADPNRSIYAGTTTGVTPFNTEETSWLDAFWGKVQNQAAWQAVGHTMDLWGVKPVQGYDPFTSGDIKGYERYADDFAYVSSPREASLLKARIERNQAREAAAQEELGFFGTLLTEAFNPVNYIPLPGLTGLGLAKGALVGAASVGALSLAEEAARVQVDPTANPNDIATNAMYSSIFGGLLGGGFGMIGAKSANKLASEAVRDFNLIEQAELGLGEAGDPIIRSGNLFEARPTGETKVGTASALFGADKLAKLTPYGRLKNLGIRAVEDLADALGGDFGTLSARNRVGGATQTSAFLSAELWRGQAAEAVQGMQRAYQLFRTGGDGTGAEVLDVNLPTAIQRTREFLGKGQSGDGMLGYEQFKGEVFKAALSGKTDDLPVGIKEGVEQVRKFFDYAGVEGSKTGLIRTAEGFKRMLASKTDRARQIMARYEELAAKSERTTQDSLELIELARQQDEALKWFEQRQRLPEDEGLRAIVERVDAELEAAGRKVPDTIADLAEKSATRRADAEAIIADIEARIAARAERDQRIIEELRAKYETEGLTQAQIDYLDLLEARQFDGAEGSLAQQSLKQRLTESINGVDRRAQEAERLIDGFDFSYNPDAPIGAKVYHGTRGDLATFVDAEGNLVLRPSENFGGQQIGVSFGVERNLAADYATRAGEGRSVRGATVFEIDTSALPKLEREAMGEAFIPTDGDIVIPAGRWQATDAITKEDVFGPPKVKDTLTPKQRDYLDLLEARLAKQGDEAPAPKNEQAYLPRFWRLDKVLDDEAGPQVLRKVLFDWFKKNPLPGARIEDEFIEARVEEAVKTILKEADSLATHDYEGAGAQFLNRRKIDIPNELVLDFIETDVEQLMRTYAEKFGLLNEYTRFFGEANAKTAIDDVILQAARELNPASLEEGTAQLATLRGDIETLRDSVTGAIYSSDPAMMNLRRLNGLARNWATLTSMGSVAFSQIVETGRQVMVNGFGRSFGFALDMLGTPEATKGVSKELRFLTGEGIDVLLSTGLQRFVDPGGPSGVGKGALGKFADKVQQATNGPFFIINGLAMLTDITKRSNLVFINQFMMEDALKLAAGKGTKKDLEKLASYGLSLEDAKKIATMPFEKKGRVILPNVSEWPDEDLARRYLVAVTGMSRRIVPTASAADLPLVARGFVAGREFPLLTLPFQFMNYGFASMNKILVSTLQGRDASPFKGAALLMGLAYLSQKLRTDDGQWERMDMSEKLVRAFDQSGLTGVFSDIPSRVERASMGDLSLRGSLGLKPTVRNPDDWSEPFNAAGPVPGKLAQLVRVSIDGDATDRERANAIRRSIPLNNLIWWRSGFDELEDMATEE
jgi:hypothetical protein